VFVACVRVADLVTIGLRAGIYALLPLAIVRVCLDADLVRAAVLERLDRHDHAALPAPRPHSVPFAR
jgi:hypothetical protein